MKQSEISSNYLLDQCIKQTETLREEAEMLKLEEDATLTRRPSWQEWSAAHCISHLNKTHALYLQRMEEAIIEAQEKGWEPEPTFSSGLLGDLTIRSMTPHKGKVKYKIKTFSILEPEKQIYDTDALFENFDYDMRHLVALMDQARAVSLRKTKVKSAAGSVIKFRLGDAFRFLIAHAQRHLLQARMAMLTPSDSVLTE